MIKIFTQNDVIRYVYNELSEEENAEIEDALLCDAEMLKAFQEISQLKRQLNKSAVHPGDRVLKNVMAYSKSMSFVHDD